MSTFKHISTNAQWIKQKCLKHNANNITEQANAGETKVENGELNGHAVPPSDSTEAGMNII